MGIPALNASTIGSKLAGFPRFRRLEGALTAFAAKARCRHLALAVAVVALALALVALVLVAFALLALAHLPLCPGEIIMSLLILAVRFFFGLKCMFVKEKTGTHKLLAVTGRICTYGFPSSQKQI